MLNSCELTFSIFSDDRDVNILMSCFNTGMGETKINICKQIQMLIEFVIIVIFGLDALLWHHDS